jgi:hypothetical protein
LGTSAYLKLNTTRDTIKVATPAAGTFLWSLTGQTPVADSGRVSVTGPIAAAWAGHLLTFSFDTTVATVFTQHEGDLKVNYADSSLAWFVTRATLNTLLGAKVDTAKAFRCRTRRCAAT